MEGGEKKHQRSLTDTTTKTEGEGWIICTHGGDSGSGDSWGELDTGVDNQDEVKLSTKHRRLTSKVKQELTQRKVQQNNTLHKLDKNLKV